MEKSSMETVSLPLVGFAVSSRYVSSQGKRRGNRDTFWLCQWLKLMFASNLDELLIKHYLFWRTVDGATNKVCIRSVYLPRQTNSEIEPGFELELTPTVLLRPQSIDHHPSIRYWYNQH